MQLECAYSTVGLQGKAMPPMISVGGWCESLGELVKRTQCGHDQSRPCFQKHGFVSTFGYMCRASGVISGSFSLPVLKARQSSIGACFLQIRRLKGDQLNFSVTVDLGYNDITFPWGQIVTSKLSF